MIERLRSRQMAKSPSSSSRLNNAFKVSSNLQGRVDDLRVRKAGVMDVNFDDRFGMRLVVLTLMLFA